LGSQTIDDIVDYVVQGTGYVGGQAGGARLDATVFKTKEEYDPADLAKLPGAKEYVLNGVKYYTISNIPSLAYPGLRVFGPTNRLVVFCCGTIPDDKFKAMLDGNKENAENISYARAGQLARQTIRGTVWRYSIEGRASPGFCNAPVVPPGDSEESKALAADWSSISQGMTGIGIKASVGSRDIRGEVIVHYRDASAANDVYKKWKEKEWIKDSEKDVPRYFKTLANKSNAGKSAVNVVRDGLSFRSSGELFIIRCEVETKLLQQGINGVINDFTRSGTGFGFPGGPPGGPPGAPGGLGPPAGAGPPGGAPRRRRNPTPAA
ncbi:MAG TPA: hypothetical protein VLM40_13840, partial [Gemmata sp.]|nr:hypothetical protein [Gemmata sp.]